VDPQIDVRPSKGQIDDLIAELRKTILRGERALVTTLTKRMSEDLAEYLREAAFNVHYLHSEIHTMERVDILHDLRSGVYDVVVGVNLLREGLDLPEVSLVAVLDADKEGFLRSSRSLIQTVGRAARNVNGRVVMYADQITDSMRQTIDETNRRRAIQTAYNTEHGIEPASIVKQIRDMTESLRAVAETEAAYRTATKIPTDEAQRLIKELEAQMKRASQELEFEKAALLRDQILELRRSVAEQDEDTPEWERYRQFERQGRGRG
jgi:excinuclease ABC subunit B